jgi:nucleotidyltransferase/DNA polymerase involved in DNA repair
LEPLPIRKIPGIGPKTEAMFKTKNIFLVRDLKKLSLSELEDLMGKWGIDLYQKIRGIDDSPLQTEYEAKSIGEQETFFKDTLDPIFIFERLKVLCRSVFERFEQGGIKSFKTVAITVRFADFETKNRAHTLKQVVSSQKILEREAIKLLLPFLDSRANPKKKLIRLIGVRIEKLS